MYFKRALICLGFGLCARPVIAADLGVAGTLFEIEERPFFEMLRENLNRPEMKDFIDAENEAARGRAEQRVRRPAPVDGLLPAREDRSYIYDPTIFADVDITDHEGQVIVAKGTRFNPLDVSPMRGSLLFIDGDDQAQREWALKTAGDDPFMRVVLTKGAPLELMEQWQRRVYFDQGGYMVSRLGIAYLPAIAQQSGDVIEIKEIALPASIQHKGAP